MKKVKNAFKKLIIIYLIVYITLSSMTSCFARGYDAECGEYVSKWSKDYVDKYALESVYSTGGTLGSLNGRAICRWSGGREGSGTFYGCCTCFVHWAYYNALGINLYDYGYSSGAITAYNKLKNGNQYFDVVSPGDLQPGDILLETRATGGHSEMYIGNGQHANFGETPMNVHNACKSMTPGGTGNAIAIRLKNSVNVNPTGTIPTDDTGEVNLSIYDENGFIYTGVPKIQGYKESKSLGTLVISMLGEILDYVIGLATLAIRAVVVGWTAIIENLINLMVNAVTGVTGKRVDNWEKDPNNIDDNDEENTQEANEIKETASQATGKPGDANYISEGVQAVADSAGNVQLKANSTANITIENIVYNKIPILDVNFFNFDSAGGAVIDENGIISIIKTNVAQWYYIFRILAIILMLLILIYLGIQIAITSAAEKKAIYKQMLISWVAGFIIIFAISYMIFAIIELNEIFINLVTPKYENGTEISLYETVRTKAYELKATTGFVGMIMYIILIYYAVRFLLVYFKRYLTITILALLSPFVGVAHALEMINKKGKGTGEILSNLLKDFTYSVTLQSVHALIYTVFIQTALKLTETSLIGIFISFIFLHYMAKMDPIWRKVFGFSGGKNAAKLSVDELAPKVALATGIAKAGGTQAKNYVNFLGRHVGGPVVNKLGGAASNLRNRISEDVSAEAQRLGIAKKAKTDEEIRKEKEEKKKARQQLAEKAQIYASLGKNILKGTLAGAAAIPIMIVETKLGIELLSAAISSKERVEKTIRSAQERGLFAKTARKGKKYTLKGVRPKNRRSFDRLKSRFEALNIKYETEYNSNTNSSKKSKSEQNTNQKTAYETKGKKLTPEGRKKLLERININNLKFASGGKKLEEVLGNGDEEGVEKALAYSRLLDEARKAEKELEKIYQEAIGKIDDEISKDTGIDPEFLKVLQDKKSKELIRIATILSKPLSEKDIHKAIQNYKNKVPTFNSDAEILSERDIEGIAKEINTLLEEKGNEFQMNTDFIEKVKNEITQSNRRKQEEKRVNKVGEDMTAKTEKQSTEETSTIDRIVKDIKTASTDAGSKIMPTASKTTIQFSQQLDYLRTLSEEAESITGEEVYNLEDILKKLEQL